MVTNQVHSSEFLRRKANEPAPALPPDILHLMVSGGIGDLIISLPWLETFRGSDIRVRIYTKFPDIAKLFLGWADIEAYPRSGMPDVFVTVSDLINFKFQKAEAKVPPAALAFYERWQSLWPEWGSLIEKHPYRCNEMGTQAVAKGLRRWTLPFEFLGVPYRKFEWDIEAAAVPYAYVTVHDGFDRTGAYDFDRSMKSWDLAYWEELINHLRHFHNVKVVQLGGPGDKTLPGVDESLVGKLSFAESLSYLKGSLLHIDGDSGLVHARRLFNKPSVVFFGPTNHDYFGYPENVNIAPGVCGDCWWKKPDWMKTCVEGYEGPRCMKSITPQLALNAIGEALRRMKQ